MIKELLLALLLLLVVAAVGGWVIFRRFEYNQLYKPPLEIQTTPAQFQLRFQEVTFVSADGITLTGWWIPANRPRATVLYCHGNASNIGHLAHLAPEFFKRGFHLLLWDYRGYGRSGGRPSEKGLYEDARAAFDAAVKLGENLPVIVYGHSLGAAVAAQLARERPAAALIIHAGFASAADIARRRYPRWPLDRLLSVSYDTAAATAALPGLPKLIGHSIQDEVIPFPSGRILFASAAPPKKFVLLEGGHGDASWFVPGQAGHSEFEAFLNAIRP